MKTIAVTVVSVLGILTAAMCYDAASEVGILKAVSGFIAWLLAWGGASGAKGSILVGDRAQKVFGIVAGVVVVFGALWLGSWTGMRGSIGGISFTWAQWCGASAVILFLVTSKADAETESSN